MQQRREHQFWVDRIHYLGQGTSHFYNRRYHSQNSQSNQIESYYINILLVRSLVIAVVSLMVKDRRMWNWLWWMTRQSNKSVKSSLRMAITSLRTFFLESTQSQLSTLRGRLWRYETHPTFDLQNSVTLSVRSFKNANERIVAGYLIVLTEIRVCYCWIWQHCCDWSYYRIR